MYSEQCVLACKAGVGFQMSFRFTPSDEEVEMSEVVLNASKIREY